MGLIHDQKIQEKHLLISECQNTKSKSAQIIYDRHLDLINYDY